MFAAMKKSLIVRVVPAVCVVVALKVAAHMLGWEVLSLNPLFSGVIAANVFLMGFLISGVLADFKESERLPTELASHIETIVDEVYIIYKKKNAPCARKCLDYMREFTLGLREWFYRRKNTHDLLGMIHGINHFVLEFEDLTQANFVARIKQEQSSLRRIILRLDTIRETSFVTSGYTIARATMVLLMLGLILSRIEPFYESLFFVSVICFLLTFLLTLIRHLDNPFAHNEQASVENVSLKVIDDLVDEMQNDLHLRISGGEKSAS